MSVPEALQDNVRKWVLIDNKIKSAQEAIRALNKEKESAGKIIIDIMKENNVHDSTY